MNQIDKHGSHYGVLYGIAAYGSWGVFPLYFKTVAGCSPLEVLAHRAMWSFVMLAVLVGAAGAVEGTAARTAEPQAAAHARLEHAVHRRQLAGVHLRGQSPARCSRPALDTSSIRWSTCFWALCSSASGCGPARR